jgi:hypothetical protein
MNVSSAPPGDLSQAADSPDEIARFVAEAAVHAPSVSGTAPWWFSATDTEMCVRADVERKLPVADPSARELTISCGAAVFTARVAMRYLGLLPDASLLPEAEVPNLVARIGWSADRKPPGDFERGLFAQIPLRRDHRGGFDTERLPAGMMSRLSEEASREHVSLRIMAAGDTRTALLAVMAAADSAFRLDGARASEGATWGTPGGQEYGVEPRTAGIVAVLTTQSDEKLDWVRAGQALQRVLLVAGSQGIEVAISARALEFAQLRDFIASELAGGEVPQLLLRFGLMRHGSPG